MFTGIVEEVGEVVAVHAAAPGSTDGGTLTVAVDTVAADLAHGASIAVDGVCLTVTGWRGRDGRTDVDFDVMGETFARTGLGARRPGDPVDLERAVRADARLGGHVVQGHVDGTGTVLSRTPADTWDLVRFSVPPGLARYVAEKGSIAVDGVSLTVAAVGRDEAGGDWFEVGLIPETLRATTLGRRVPGDVVNLEVDVLAKYTERLLQATGAVPA